MARDLGRDTILGLSVEVPGMGTKIPGLTLMDMGSGIGIPNSASLNIGLTLMDFGGPDLGL